jgi:hypothetical protein
VLTDQVLVGDSVFRCGDLQPFHAHRYDEGARDCMYIWSLNESRCGNASAVMMVVVRVDSVKLQQKERTYRFSRPGRALQTVQLKRACDLC